MGFQSTRRDFLQAIGTGAVGLAATQVAQAATSITPDSNRFARRSAKHLIVLNLSGGLSHIDTFDPKPAAALEYRNIDAVCQTAIPGINLTENLPRLAARLQDVSLIRTLHHDGPATHEAGRRLFQTEPTSISGSEIGWDRLIATEVARSNTVFSSFSSTAPNHVALGQLNSSHAGHQGSFVLDDVGERRNGTHTNLGNQFNASDSHTLGIVRVAEREQQRYGNHALGRDCLRARLLVERGVRVVSIDQFATVYDQVTWDMHANGGRLRTTHQDYRQTLCPQLDQALSALLDDLKSSGLLSETVVVAVSEMGRTPRINCYGGRDHHAGVWTGLIAGGPLQCGQVIGESDAIGEFPLNRPVRLGELKATILRAMGLDGQTESITSNICLPIAEL